MYKRQVDKLIEVFSKLAVAYQIRDDEADFLGNKTGRTTASDILNDRPNLYHLLSKSPLYSSNFVMHASSFHEKLIGEAQAGLEAFPDRLSVTTRNLVLPFVQLSPVPDPSLTLSY